MMDTTTGNGTLGTTSVTTGAAEQATSYLFWKSLDRAVQAHVKEVHDDLEAALMGLCDVPAGELAGAGLSPAGQQLQSSLETLARLHCVSLLLTVARCEALLAEAHGDEAVAELAESVMRFRGDVGALDFGEPTSHADFDRNFSDLLACNGGLADAWLRAGLSTDADGLFDHWE